MRMSSGPSRAEAEAARRIVELEGGDAEVEHDPIERRHAGFCQQGKHVAETSVQQMQPCRESGAASAAPRAIASGSRSIAHSVQRAAPRIAAA